MNQLTDDRVGGGHPPYRDRTPVGLDGLDTRRVGARRTRPSAEVNKIFRNYKNREIDLFILYKIDHCQVA
ncbi:MAG: hypothetical protein P8Y68_07120, partial [Anaerolineales bacterium]